MTTAKTWETRRCRAFSLKSGDVVELWDGNKRRPVRATVKETAPSPEFEDHVLVRFRRWKNWAMHIKRTTLMRVRRLKP